MRQGWPNETPNPRPSASRNLYPSADQGSVFIRFAGSSPIHILEIVVHLHEPGNNGHPGECCVYLDEKHNRLREGMCTPLVRVEVVAAAAVELEGKLNMEEGCRARLPARVARG